MPKPPDLTEAKRIAAKMLAMPPKPHETKPKEGAKPEEKAAKSLATQQRGKPSRR